MATSLPCVQWEFAALDAAHTADRRQMAGTCLWGTFQRRATNRHSWSTLEVKNIPRYQKPSLNHWLWDRSDCRGLPPGY